MEIIRRLLLEACSGRGSSNSFGLLLDNPHVLSRANVTSAEAGQCVSLALKRIRRAAVRKGMVLVNKTDVPPRGEHLW